MKKAFGLGFLLLGAFPACGWADTPAERLVQAVRGDDHAAIKKLLAAHANPNAPGPDKSTALSWAVDRQDETSVGMLLAAGAKPNVTDIEGASPLTLACELGSPAIVTDLLKAGADAKAARPDGITALALCAGTSTPEALAILLAKGAAVNGTDPQGQTALMWAATKGRTDNIAFLIKSGANVNAVEQEGFTPLFFALRSKVPAASLALLDAGADSNAVLPQGRVSVAAAAVVENNIPFAMQVVSRGTDLGERDSQGRQLIHIAAASGNADLVKLVLSKGGDANAPSQPPPVQVAQVVTPPAAGGGSGKLARADGSTVLAGPAAVATPPLLFAAKAGSADAMKVLVDDGAKPDAKAADGTTLALAAAGGGNLAALKYALTLDPNLNAIGPGGKSILHFAIANRQPDTTIPILQYLADKGAKLDVKDTRGDTPGDVLNRGGQQDIRIFYIQLLKAHGIVGTAH
jgi:ankyrin repeat protein